MAQREITLISQGLSFIVNSLSNGLQREGLDVKHTEPTLDDIEQSITADHTAMVLVFSGEFVTVSPGVVTKAADKCDALNIPFCLVGYPNEVEELEKHAKVSSITAEFSRPFEVKDVLKDIKDILQGSSFAPLEGASQHDNDVKDKHRIMLCDDDTMFLKILQDWLGSKYHLTAVKTGMMALTLAAKNKPELLLLDYEMPVMSGAAVLEKLREDKKTADIPVVFLTGHSDKASVLKVMSLKPQGYLLKTTSQEDLLALLDNFFASGKWKNQL